MASFPQQQRLQRQSSGTTSSTNREESSFQRDNRRSPSAKSVDSQTLLLDGSLPSAENTQSTASQNRSASAPQSEGSEPRKCWICFSDETEDDPQTASPWKTPCPCALTAHESCLLDWIADMEAPEGDRSASSSKEIKCPQCKSEIHLSRPRSLIVEAVSRVEKISGQMLLPGVAIGSAYTLFIGCSHHGAHTIRMIFGQADADAILAQSAPISETQLQLLRYVPVLAKPFFRGWRGLRVELGLPLIPLALIASRTSFADTILPFLPIMFFATYPQHQYGLTYGFWPPSAALTFVVLPYARSVYEDFLERTWGEHERRWTKEVRPRLGDATGENENRDANNNNDNDANNGEVVQLQIDIEEEFEDDDEANEHVEQPERRGARAPPLEQAPNDAEEEPNHGENRAENETEQGQRDNHRQQQQNHHHHHRVDINFLAYATRFAETTLGALLFPTVSAAMGDALRFVLPTAWTIPRMHWAGRPVPMGLLQTRWGRSVVGGCLFVIFKDAVRIYCKWKMAQAFRKRRILNYDKKLGKVIW